jgi:ligand-binding sensor domain-containing protein/serine phosphatase RsbU (regulator of sigma subunit)
MKRKLRYILLTILLGACHSQPSDQEKAPDQIAQQDENFVLVHQYTKDTIDLNQSYPLDSAIPVPLGTRYMNSLNPYQKTELTYRSNLKPIRLKEKNYLTLDSTFENKPKDLEELLPPKEFEISISKNRAIHPDQKSVFPWSYRDAAQYNIQILSTDQGLVSNQINSIYQDNRDFMWFGTEAGLVRFDGRFTKTYTTQNGLQDQEITHVREDSKGNLWLGTANSGIIKFDGQYFYQIPIDSIIQNVPIHALEIDENDNVWFTPLFGGVAYFDGEKIYSYGAEQGIHTHRPINSIHFDDEGRKWFAANGWGVYRLDQDGMKVVYSGHGYIPDLFIDSKGTTWLGAWMGEIDRIKNDTIYHLLLETNYADEITTQIEEDSKGNIWALTYSGGIYRIDGETSYHYGTEEGVSSTYINSFFIDRQDRIWLATKGGGVSRLDPNSFDCVNNYSGDFNGYVNGMGILEDSTEVLATNKGLYFRKNGSLERITFETDNAKGSQLMNTPAHDVLVTGDTIWTTHLNGGIQMTTSQGLCIMGKGMSGGATNPTSMTKDKSGVIWIGTASSGIYKIEDDSLSRFIGENGLAFGGISELYCDQSNRIWVGSEKNGLAVIEDSNVKYFNTNNDLIDNTITHLTEDDQGRVWIATNKGLNYYENQQFHTIKSDLSFFQQHISGIEQDQYGKYWITSQNGLAILTPEQENQGNWSIDNYRFKLINKKNGLINSTFIDNSIFLLEDRIYLGNEGGLMSWPLINDSNTDLNSPKLFLNDLFIKGESLLNMDNSVEGISADFETNKEFNDLPELLEVSYLKNDFEFSFSAIHWSDPRGITYRYRLVGLEEDWNEAGSDNKASYKNLSYGDYTFELKASKYDGSETETLRYAFSILRPWYHSWWARVLYIIGFLLIIYSFIQVRTQQLKRRQEQLENEIEEATDEIRQQKNEIEIAHEEIKDSIEYAKRIQTAILPPTKLVKSYIPNSFVLYKPKDIVAGDFYWMEPQDDRILFAAADCTGHGVPGAMVSVICNGGLNRSVREFGLSEPGDILTKTRELVIAEFEKSEEEVKDGMDIALCSLEVSSSVRPLTDVSRTLLKYAGAHNPLWVIRKGSNEIEEIKADKQPIGKYADEKPFTTHVVELNEGDTFYIFSDGFADQFGGDKGKKFKATNFKKLLLSIQSESIEKQRELIDEAFEDWKGSLEQLDDVCIIGVQI